MDICDFEISDFFFLVLINKDDRFISILENDRVFYVLNICFRHIFCMEIYATVINNW